MVFFQQLISNKIFWVAALGWFVAQVLKTIIHTALTKEFVLERMVGSGGMPSSHSSTVCSLATAVFYEYGADGFEFAVAAVLAIIVMHDAMGVRLETGRQAKLLNDIMETFKAMGRNEFSAQETLKEFVGHTPLQVIMGAILGIVMTIGIYQL